MAPIAVGLLPFALVIGTTVSESDAGLAGWAGSWLIFGGSAHLATMRVFNASAGPSTVRITVGDNVATGEVVDLRGRTVEPFPGSLELRPWQIATMRLA